VAGATWPNRLYALTGRSDGTKENKSIPWYNLPSFVRHLDERKVSWRWYAFENLAGVPTTTLRLTDGRYRFSGGHAKFDPDFISDTAAGRLPSVSWIDPNFVDFGDSTGANDDHPPADITAGQELVLKVYHAISRSPQWSKTLFVIVYDEHGGFYDHVGPPQNAQDDNPQFRSYGVRVPAIVVSPWVARQGVTNTLFDHTSIIKTILLRFCRRSDGSIPSMGARVMAANHLGGLLIEPTPRQPPDMASYEAATDHIAAWHAKTFKARLRTFGLEAQRPPRKLTDFQRGLLEASKRLAKEKAKVGR
jgi:phospholipase C